MNEHFHFEHASPVPWWLYLLRLLPVRLRGKARLSRLLSRLYRHEGPISIRTQGLLFAAPSFKEPVAQSLVWNDVYEPDTATAIKRHLPPAGVFLDVGANIGCFAITAAHHWVPQGRVLAIEASPAIHAYLTHNAAVNPSPNLTILHAAVTGKRGDTINFYDAPAQNFGMGSLSKRGTSTAVPVPTITVDDALAAAGITQLDVLKVDVEGHELGVFQGATRTLQQVPPPVILFEFVAWAENREGECRAGDAQRFLIAQGYSIQRLDDYLRHGKQAGAVMEHGGADLVAWKDSALS